MKKINLLAALLSLSFTISCSDLDNYGEPGETLTGRVIDQTTGEGFITEQPNGFRLKLSEISWSDHPQAEYFWGKSDGSFQNTKLFPATYEVTPVEGAFFPIEPTKVEVKGTTNIEFKVTPYLNITADVKREGEKLNISYTLSRAKESDKIIDARIFVSTNPNVGTNVFENELSPMTDLSKTDDKEILKKTYTQTITGLVNKTYYVRVGARTNNANKRYNFTKIVEVN